MTNQPEEEWWEDDKYWASREYWEEGDPNPLFRDMIAEAHRRGKVEGLKEASNIIQKAWDPVPLALFVPFVIGRINSRIASLEGK